MAKQVDVSQRATGPARARCAIYTRKSTEEGLEQEFNSLHAQREAAEAYIKSQKHLGRVLLKTAYDDGGFSGGNMDRPALQQLLADVDARRVDCIIVYKVDRLSRSLLDFARLIDRFDQRSVSFVSVTQQFNTTSSLGRLTLNILLSFAQFEREIISERTRDKMSAARRKGKWVGGTPMLGYDVDPAGGRLVVNEKEACRVREMYELFRTHQSLAKVVEEIDRRRWTTKVWTSRSGRKHEGVPFDQRSLRHHLTRAMYAGQVEYRGTMYDGEHACIVDRAIWEEVNAQLRSGVQKDKAPRTKQNALLAGLLFCKNCNKPMIPTYATKRGVRYRYYLCTTAKHQGWAACPTKTVSASVIEESVAEQIKTRLALEEAREELDVGDQEWQRFAAGESHDLVRSLVEKVTYDGRTGNVSLDLQPHTGSERGDEK